MTATLHTLIGEVEAAQAALVSVADRVAARPAPRDRARAAALFDDLTADVARRARQVVEDAARWSDGGEA